MVHGNSCCNSIFHLGDSTPQPLVVLFMAPEFRSTWQALFWHRLQLAHFPSGLHSQLWDGLNCSFFVCLFCISLLFKGHQVGRNLKTRIQITKFHCFRHYSTCLNAHYNAQSVSKKREMQLSLSSPSILTAVENPGIKVWFMILLHALDLLNFDEI